MSVPNEIQAEVSDRGVRFQVDEVSPGRANFRQLTMRQTLRATLRRSLIAVSDPDRQLVHGTNFAYADTHGLLNAVHSAFAKHLPLSLDPDSIWLTIAQGFSRHVNENAEKLRGQLVEHEGKRELVVRAPDDFSVTSDADWAEAVAAFATQISEHVKVTARSWLECDFSTTTPVARTASQIVLMETFQSFFDYSMVCICGIPTVTLRGTVEDWRKIRSRLDGMEGFALDWWLERLRPIADQFVAAAEGHPDRSFWQEIIKPKPIYADTQINGWITDLFPYLENRDNHPARRNPIFDVPRSQLTAENGVGASQFPNGRSEVPITLKFPDGNAWRLKLVAGFVGFTQEKAGDLRPALGWCVVERRKAQKKSLH